MPCAVGRTQPTPSASRSVGAELTGEFTSKLGIWCSKSLDGPIPKRAPTSTVRHKPSFTHGLKKLSPTDPKSSWPLTNGGQGPATDFKHPTEWGDANYSSLPSKHKLNQECVEGLRVPPIPATPGRTQPTPSASRSVGAELTGVAISIFGIECSNHWTGEYPNGDVLQR